MTMSHKRSPASAAVVAALILLVQAFVGGTWMGAQAASDPRDLFGNVICTAHTSDTSQNGKHGNSGNDCECCLSSCDTGTATVPETTSIEPVLVDFALALDGKHLTEPSVRRHELQPLSSRGPPA